MVEVIKKSDFESKVEQSEGLVLVDFYADWCNPCKMLGPVVADVAKVYEGKVKFYKLNVDNAQDIAIKYRVVSIPMLILFKDGKQINSSIGFVDADTIKAMF